MKTSLGAALVAGGVMLSGCATIISDSKYPVSIQSDPPGARYLITNTKKHREVTSGVTPALVTLPAKNGFFSKATYEVVYEMPGFESVSVPLQAGMDGWYLGNLIFGGLLGLFILDPATGAMWKLDDGVHTTLVGLPEPEQEGMPAGDDLGEEAPALENAEPPGTAESSAA